MIAVTHQTFGMTFGLVAILLLQLANVQPHGFIETIIFFCLVLFGSLLPDLDTPHSKIGKKLWPISFVISSFVKHRTATHSLLFVVIVSWISWFLFSLFDLSWFFTLGIAIGTISHLIGDWLTKMGVPFFYPFYKKRYKAPFTFKTGSSRENTICIILFVLNIALFFLLLPIPYKSLLSLF